MKRSERRKWASARSLSDLGELTAQWLEGRIASQPCYVENEGPDPETQHLIPVLARVNRAGFVTHSSQPGRENQRAAVTGFARQERAWSLEDALLDTELVVYTHRIRRSVFLSDEENDGMCVTMAGVTALTRFGHSMDREYVELVLEEVGEGALEEAVNGRQVSVIDPVWGRDDLLWPLLDEWARRTSG